MTSGTDRTTSYLLIFVIMTVFSHPGIAADLSTQSKSYASSVMNPASAGQSSLSEARENLSLAFDAYREGDLERTRTQLNAAGESLQKARDNSKSEKARDETSKLASEIEDFKTRLSQHDTKQENSLARFWLRATSIIKRETEQLIQDYVELSNAEKMLKHLLDAKMHFFTAEHDLFISHDAEDAGKELTRTLDYLDKASELPVPAMQPQIESLSHDIQSLKESLTSVKQSWINDSVIQSLDKALNDLSSVDNHAPPAFKLRVESIQADIRMLRDNVARENIRNKYESAMTTLRNMINEL
ncbi:MAG: hypothetical protein H8E21_06725 [Gammaproteobacteria bacterium]|nr:hypothetical protein [Gammaproteobacteria bacterium]